MAEPEPGLLPEPAPEQPARGPLEALCRVLAHGAAWLFLVAIAISAYEVVMRYVFTAPSAWVNETTTALCAVAFALGGAWCMAQGEHVRITFLLDRVHGRPRQALEILALVVGVVYLGGLGYALIGQASDAVWRFGAGGRWTPELTPGPPNWPLPSITKSVLALGTVLFLLVTLTHLARRLTGRLRSP